jgi:hypothetical protein
MIERVDGWPAELNRLVESARFKPFVWGVHDCGSFVCQAYETLTGIKPPDIARPRDSLMDYLRCLVKWNGLAEIMDQTFGPSVEGYQHARRGDIVMVESPRVEQVGVKQASAISLGNHIACTGLTGLEFLSLTSVVRVWRIGS